jgi:hypothetical protein
MQSRQCCGPPRAGQIRTGNDLTAHARLRRTRHHRVTILCETVMREIRTNIDQIQAQGGNTSICYLRLPF